MVNLSMAIQKREYDGTDASYSKSIGNTAIYRARIGNTRNSKTGHDR